VGNSVRSEAQEKEESQSQEAEKKEREVMSVVTGKLSDMKIFYNSGTIAEEKWDTQLDPLTGFRLKKKKGSKRGKSVKP